MDIIWVSLHVQVWVNIRTFVSKQTISQSPPSSGTGFNCVLLLFLKGDPCYGLFFKLTFFFWGFNRLLCTNIYVCFLVLLLHFWFIHYTYNGWILQSVSARALEDKVKWVFITLTWIQWKEMFLQDYGITSNNTVAQYTGQHKVQIYDSLWWLQNIQ